MNRLNIKQMLTRHAMIILLLLLVAASGNAETVNNIYQVSLPVASKSDSERASAIISGFKEVVTRVSGSRALIDDGAMKQKIAQYATGTISQFSYDSHPLADQHEQLYINIKYQPALVNEFLRNAHQPIWGIDRPSVLIWLGVSDGQDQQIVGHDSDSGYYRYMSAEAKLRGLPIMLPLLDLHDRQQVSFRDVWAPFPWIIEKASERYKNDAILIGRLAQLSDDQQAAPVWQAHWSLTLNNKTSDWVNSGDDAEKVLTASMDKLVDMIASRYAVASDQQQSHVKLAVYGVKGVTGYHKIDHYLKQLTPVTSVSLDTIYPDYVVLDVVSLGGQVQLSQAIDVDHLLIPMVVLQADDSHINLTYQLIS